MKQPITFRTVISMMLVLLFSLPVQAQDYGSLEGTVQDENGEYMEGVVVEAFLDGIKQGEAITGHDGSYNIKPIKKGKYEVRGRYADYENVEIKDVVVVGFDPTGLDMNFIPKVFPEVTMCGRVRPLMFPEPVTPVSITGKLKDAFNRPAAGVSVDFYRFDTARNGEIDTFSTSVITSEKGCYKMEGLTPGVYFVSTDFNGLKTMEKTIVIKKKEYVKEIVANFFFNKKIFDNHGKLADHEATVTVRGREDIMKSPIRN